VRSAALRAASGTGTELVQGASPALSSLRGSASSPHSDATRGRNANRCTPHPATARRCPPRPPSPRSLRSWISGSAGFSRGWCRDRGVSAVRRLLRAGPASWARFLPFARSGA